MKYSFYSFLLVFAIIVSCKKENSNTTNTPITQNPANTSISISSLSQQEFGNCYFYETGSNPVTVLSNGDVIISSLKYDGVGDDKINITKINSAGNILWNKIIDRGKRYKKGSTFVSSQGDLIYIGTEVEPFSWTSAKVFIAKINISTGDTIWTRAYGNGYIDYGIIGHETNDGNYEIVDYSSQDYIGTIIKVSPSGDSLTSYLNTETYTKNYEDALFTSDNGVLMAGSSGNFINGKRPIYLCKYKDGVKIFSNNIVLDSLDEIRVMDIIECSDGGFLIGGETNKFSNTSLKYAFLVKTDNNGARLWEKILPQSSYKAINSFVEYQPNVFVISLNSNPLANLYKYDLTSLSLINSNLSNYGNDGQLIIKSGKLYRSVITQNSSYYQIVKLMTYSIQ